MSIYTAIMWIMFVGLFPLSFFWLRRAWLIWKKKDYSFVALKRGVPPEEPQKYAKYALIINLAAGLIFLFVILSIIIIQLEDIKWTAIAGITLWMKILADFTLSRHAHFKVKK